MMSLLAFSFMMVMAVSLRCASYSCSSRGSSTRPRFSIRASILSIPPTRRFDGTVTLPGSKSITNRAVLLAALCNGTTLIENALDGEDTVHMVNALRNLKVECKWDKASKIIEVAGNPCFADHREAVLRLDLGNAGTAMRSLTAVLGMGKKSDLVLDGVPRMRERPIADLTNALSELGCNVECSATGCPPVRICPASGETGGTARVLGGVSSQYLSALLLAAPLADAPVRIEVIGGALVSAPYVKMTIQMMRAFGVNVEESGDVYTVQPAQYTSPSAYLVEGDASSASYFLAAGAILGGPVTVSGVGVGSIQGDVRFARILQRMGATVSFAQHSITVQRDLTTPLVGVDEDCGDIPDAAMTLAMVGLFARGQTAVRNVYNWRVKETERMVAMVTELRKLGATVEEGKDYLIVQGLRPGESLRDEVTIETYNDHRMAMCFALAACGGVSVQLSNPECVQKTFPTFFSEFFSLANR